MSDALIWIKSSYSPSGSGHDCVEVAHGADFVAMRDSKAPDAGRITMPRRQWGAFLASITSEEGTRRAAGPDATA